MTDPGFYEQVISDYTGRRPEYYRVVRQEGGCIHIAEAVETNLGSFFIKHNDNIPGDMFEKEFRGLSLLLRSGRVQVPRPFSSGKAGDRNYLLMEYIKPALRNSGFWEKFGSSLAELHMSTGSGIFGLDHDNYIGRLPQQNKSCETWPDFFIHRRLEVQLNLALQLDAIPPRLSKQFESLFNKLPDLIPDCRPSLLHGDLWSGNFMTGGNGGAILLDPAVYYGNREAEIAFTGMFGGFDPAFYDAYNESWPLETGFDDRIALYNLYPSLVHLNMFGQAYLGGIIHVLDRFA